MVERATCDQLANKVDMDMAAVLKYAHEIQHHAEKQETRCIVTNPSLLQLASPPRKVAICID